MESSIRETQKRALLQFAGGAAVQSLGGFGRLQSDGTVSESLGAETWINARMAYCFALEVLGGNEQVRSKAELGCIALSTTLRDGVHGGWVEAVGPNEIANSNKAGYAHAFVLLAASALDAASIEGSAELLREAKQVIEKRFWSENEGACIESLSQDW
jgi:sulfoquinovose isomerase